MCVLSQQVLEERIPFLLSSIKDFQQHVPNDQDSMVSAIYQSSMPKLYTNSSEIVSLLLKIVIQCNYYDYEI